MVQNECHLLLDFVMWVIVVGIRRGAFRDYDNIEELLNGDDTVIHWKPEFLEKPVLVAHDYRSKGLDYDKPLSFEHAFEVYKGIVASSGLYRASSTDKLLTQEETRKCKTD